MNRNLTIYRSLLQNRGAFFINNSYSMEDLRKANDQLNKELLFEENKNNPRIAMFINSSLVGEIARIILKLL